MSTIAFLLEPGAGVSSAVEGGILPNATRIWRQSLRSPSCTGATSENSPRFRTLGRSRQHRISPEGMADLCASSVVSSGLIAFLNRVPKVEALGYCQKSVRDEKEILVALGILPPGVDARNLRGTSSNLIPPRRTPGSTAKETSTATFYVD